MNPIPRTWCLNLDCNLFACSNHVQSSRCPFQSSYFLEWCIPLSVAKFSKSSIRINSPVRPICLSLPSTCDCIIKEKKARFQKAMIHYQYLDFLLGFFEKFVCYMGQQPRMPWTIICTNHQSGNISIRSYIVIVSQENKLPFIWSPNEAISPSMNNSNSELLPLVRCNRFSTNNMGSPVASWSHIQTIQYSHQRF